MTTEHFQNLIIGSGVAGNPNRKFHGGSDLAGLCIT